MICLTGDVHNRKVRRPDTKSVPGHEIEHSTTYASVAGEYDVPVTLFIDGLSCVRHPNEAFELANAPLVEVGGHTYTSFRPWPLHHFYERTIGMKYGPKWHQRLDVRRSLDAIWKTTLTECTSWRTHEYCSNEQTYDILRSTSVSVISDAVSSSPYPHVSADGELLSLPINTPRDDVHLVVNDETTDTFEKKYKVRNWSEAYAYDGREWLTAVKGRIERIERAGGVAIVQAHPIYMKELDDFATFERLCSWISDEGYRAVTCGDVADMVG